MHGPGRRPTTRDGLPDRWTGPAWKTRDVPETPADPVARFLDAVVSITSELDLDEILDRIVDGAMAITGARYGALGVSDGEQLVRFTARGVSDGEARAIGRWPRGHGVLGVLLHDARPLRVDDLAAHPAAEGLPPGHPPMRTFLGVPILVHDAVYGDLYLAEKDDGTPFTEDDQRATTALAAAAGSAIENARLSAQARRAAVERDRERIADDLHDVVVQRLFASGLTLMATARTLPSGSARDRLEQVVDDLDGTVREIRRTIAGLRGTGPGDPLSARVHAVAASAAATLGFEADVIIEAHPETQVPDEVGDQVVVVLGEALTNVARHARASAVTVHVRVGPSRVELVVDDDGVGYVPGPRRSGLANLERRARALQGSLDVGPGPRGGTRLRWDASWEPAA